eukprot:GHRQ01014069.1.p1 GENE.GHRQ01014069.1~~GHRQ01014069.1.p1  ORF type:complete len:139 (+),score=14.31 GHRQ01014069.1:564-980(+)
MPCIRMLSHTQHSRYRAAECTAQRGDDQHAKCACNLKPSQTLPYAMSAVPQTQQTANSPLKEAVDKVRVPVCIATGSLLLRAARGNPAASEVLQLIVILVKHCSACFTCTHSCTSSHAAEWPVARQMVHTKEGLALVS